MKIHDLGFVVIVNARASRWYVQGTVRLVFLDLEIRAERLGWFLSRPQMKSRHDLELSTNLSLIFEVGWFRDSKKVALNAGFRRGLKGGNQRGPWWFQCVEQWSMESTGSWSSKWKWLHEECDLLRGSSTEGKSDYALVQIRGDVCGELKIWWQ